MRMFLKILGFIWLLPATIPYWLFYIIPLILFDEITYVRKASTFVWEFENYINPASWYDQLWSKWAGWSGPCVIIIYEKVYEDPKQLFITRNHEEKHGNDRFIWGIFFDPAFFINSLWIGISNLWKSYENKRHIYYSNWFEIRARKAAGQLVNIPRNQWLDGPDDYNPWI